MATTSTTAEVISAAGSDPFTLAALVILVLAMIARSWFTKAPHRIKERVFYVLLLIGVAFGSAGIARVWPAQTTPTSGLQVQTQTPNPSANPPASTPSPTPPTAQQEQRCPGGMPRFSDGECLPIPGVVFTTPEMKVKLRDRCRALKAQGITHDGYTSTDRCFDHGAG